MAVITVGRVVHYYDREEIVNADFAKRDPEPFPAIVTRVHRGADGEPTDLVNLAVMDPELGHQVKRDVSFGGTVLPTNPISAHRWYWPPIPAAAPPVQSSTPAADENTTTGDESGEDTADGDDSKGSRGGSRKKK